MRYAVVSDIHANFTALKEIVKTLQAENHAQFWFLGDLVGYGPAREALECIQWLRFYGQLGERWLPGNHDEWILNHFDRVAKDAAVTLTYTQSFLERPATRDDWNWFKDEVTAAIAPAEGSEEKRSLVKEFFPQAVDPSLALVFTHGSVDSSTRRLHYLYDKESVAVELHKLRSSVEAKTVCLVYGHTHFPMFVRMNQDGKVHYQSINYHQPLPMGDGYLAICPGSVGQPRDRDPRASFVVIDTDEKTVEFRRIEYSVEVVISKLTAERNDPRVREALEARNLPLVWDDGGGKKIVYANYAELAQAAYDSLIRRLRHADGGARMQDYFARAYRMPKWDLEALD